MYTLVKWIVVSVGMLVEVSILAAFLLTIAIYADNWQTIIKYF